jgi:hypothetical protein
MTGMFHVVGAGQGNQDEHGKNRSQGIELLAAAFKFAVYDWLHVMIPVDSCC